MKDDMAGRESPTGIFHAATYSGIFSDAVEVSVTYRGDGEVEWLQSLASVSIIRALSEHDIDRILTLPSRLQVKPGARVRLTAMALDRDGIPVPDVAYTWEVLDPAAGTINEQGEFVAGPTVDAYPDAVRVVGYKRQDQLRTVAATIPVEVHKAQLFEQPTKVNLYPQAVILRPGDAMEFRALMLDGGGNLYDSVETSWALNDPDAGALDEKGVFQTGSQPGTYPDLVEITVTPLGVEPPMELNATATVTVLPPMVEAPNLQRVILDQRVLRLRPGESAQLTATAVDSTGGVSRPSSARWSTTQDVAEVGPDGTVIARDMPGTYEDVIVVELEEEGVVRRASATLIILGPLARIEVLPLEVTVAPNQVIQFVHVAYDINGVRLFDATATWELLDRTAGSINSFGLFIAGSEPGEYSSAVKVTVTQDQT